MSAQLYGPHALLLFTSHCCPWHLVFGSHTLRIRSSRPGRTHHQDRGCSSGFASTGELERGSVHTLWQLPRSPQPWHLASWPTALASRTSSASRKIATAATNRRRHNKRALPAQSAMRPNPSFKPTRYGRQRKPGLRHLVHHLSPGLRCLPPRAA